MIPSKFFISVTLYVIVWLLSISNTRAEAESGNDTIVNQTFTDKLRKRLLKIYKKVSRPNEYYNKTTVKFGLAIMHVEVLEATSAVNFYTILRLTWMDRKLEWEPEDYGGISTIRLASDELWRPTIFLYNSATVATAGYYGRSHLLLYPNGEILHVPPQRLSVLCDINLKYWPYDEQKCQLSFGPWSSNGEEIELQLYNRKKFADLTDMIIENNQWKITENTAELTVVKFSGFKDEYTGITYNITLTRKSPVYGCLIITPAIFITISALIPFWMIPHGYGRVYVGCLTLLVIFSLLSYFNKILPSLGNHTPSIISFYSHSLYIVSLGIIESMVVIWMINTIHSNPVPWRIKKYFKGKLGMFTGFTPRIQQDTANRAEEMRDHQVTDAESITGARQIIGTSNKLIKEEWYSFASAVDRLTFVFYCLLFFIMVIAVYI